MLFNLFNDRNKEDPLPLPKYSDEFKSILNSGGDKNSFNTYKSEIRKKIKDNDTFAKYLEDTTPYFINNGKDKLKEVNNLPGYKSLLEFISDSDGCGVKLPDEQILSILSLVSSFSKTMVLNGDITVIPSFIATMKPIYDFLCKNIPHIINKYDTLDPLMSIILDKNLDIFDIPDELKDSLGADINDKKVFEYLKEAINSQYRLVKLVSSDNFEYTASLIANIENFILTCDRMYKEGEIEFESYKVNDLDIPLSIKSELINRAKYIKNICSIDTPDIINSILGYNNIQNFKSVINMDTISNN